MKILKKDNLLLFIPLLILNLISLFNMINAKYINPVYNNAFYKQLLWFILGYFIIFITSKIKCQKLFKYAKYLYLFSLLLLLLVLFVGDSANGAKCWFNIGGISFQPSELMKLSLTLYLTEMVIHSRIKTLKDEIFTITKLVIITLIPSILVFLEPDTGAIINFFIILLVVIIFLKLNKWWYILFFTISSLGLLTFFIMYFFFQDTLIQILGTSFFYRMDRIINFASGNSYQLENALITIGAASLFGVGFNKILLYIPEAPTDFFFSFSIGNFGIISGIIIIIAFIIINSYLIYKITHLKDFKLQIFATCYLSILIFHQIYNISMNLGLLPIMGIPLPFLSYGGTNTLINYLFLGIILNFFKKNSLNY